MFFKEIFFFIVVEGVGVGWMFLGGCFLLVLKVLFVKGRRFIFIIGEVVMFDFGESCLGDVIFGDFGEVLDFGELVFGEIFDIFL